MKKETYEALKRESREDAVLDKVGGVVRPTGASRGAWRKKGKLAKKGAGARRRSSAPVYEKPWERKEEPNQFEQQLAAAQQGDKAPIGTKAHELMETAEDRLS